ncbi:hypothetical protein MRB53_019142 [Persea americana]|uniref:Uncharacterized protein n=1 Tax=Persea americana TaxID=3435 RepID=A0ACC2MAJ8_PERAE|nr:hypothetical protein MRB53_019142 [Persea americana]
MLLQLKTSWVEQRWPRLNLNSLLFPWLNLLPQPQIKDVLSKEIIGCGTKRGGLYYLDDFSPGKANHTHHHARSHERQIWLWHRRLGHPSFGYLRHLLPSLFSHLQNVDFKCFRCYDLTTNRTYITMDVTFLESENFYASPVPNSSLQGETQVEEMNWLMAPVGEHGTGNREVEPHEVPPEMEYVELRNEEAEEPGNEETENTEYPQSPHSSVPEDPPPENVPEVSTPATPLHANILDSSTGYVLPVRHNRGKPPNKYSLDEEGRKSKYPIANYVSTQEVGLLECKPMDTPIVQNHRLGEYSDQAPADKVRAMASGSESAAGTTLMDLITADPSTVSQSTPAAAAAASASAPSTLGKPPQPDRRPPKKGTFMQIQSDTISVAKALNPVRTNIIPQKQKKKPVSYSQLARSIHELAAASDQKSSQKQLVNHVFPKLAVYNSVDPSIAPSLLMLDQQCEDRSVLRYVYYYLARILSDNGAQGLTPGGGIPTPNWDALADIDAVGGVTRADVVPRIVEQLTSEASNADIEFHARRLAALKALTFAPASHSEILAKLYEIVFGILEKVADTKQKRKKGVFGKQGGDKESIIRSNLQYAAISALRRLPLDPGNPAFLHRAIQGVSFSDPVAVRHALAMISDLATRDPYPVAMALGKLVLPGGALQDVLHLHDVLARISLARLCHTLSRARALDERPDIKSQFTSVLYQLLLDPSDRVCFEAILCVLGKFDNTERTEERAAGWIRLTREILKLPEAPSMSSKENNVQSKDALPPKSANDKPASKLRRPQLLIKLVMRRLLNFIIC